MSNAVLMIPPYLQFFDSNGAVLNGGSVTCYAAGTTTLKAIFTDPTAGTQAANPITLDSAGRCQIWGSGSYKFIVKDALGNTIETVDNVTAYTTPSNASNAEDETFSGDGSTKVFTTAQDLGTNSSEVYVWIDAGDGKGYNIQLSSAFTVSGTTLTFVTAPTSGTNNILVRAPDTASNSAASSAATAATSETNAANSATLASEWASQTSGQVASTDYSAKAWSIGGTGVTTSSGKGAAKEWATTTGGAVDTVDYSAKEYAIGTTVAAGSAKEWATKLSTTVDGTDYSAKYEAQAAATSASAASNSASAASSSASAASTSATDAAASATSAANAVIGVANSWKFASSTTMGDPSSGNFRMNSATFASVTNIALSYNSGDSGNPDLHAFALTWDDSTHSNKGYLRVVKDASNFIIFSVSGTITDNTTWLEVPVTVIESAGSFTAADVIYFQFAASGNDGTGSGNVSSSGTPTTGSLIKWASSSTIANADLTGDVTTSGGVATSIGSGKVTNTMLAGSIAASKLVGTDIATVGTLTGGATGAGFTVALGSSTISGQLTETHGGTNQTSYAKGDILYASGTNTLAKLTAGTDGKVLTLASGIPSWATATGGAINIQTFTTPGSATWTKPGSGTWAYVQVWGAGASGAAHTGTTSSSGGGGGGGFTDGWFLLSTLGATETVQVGQGGAAIAAATTANGNAGGFSSFGSWLAAYGGGAGAQVSANGGGGGGGGGPYGPGSNASSSTGGAGAGPLGGAAVTNSPGGENSGAGGGGGGSGTTTQPGGNSVNGGGGGGAGMTSAANGGSGGNSVKGGGGGGGCTGTAVPGTGGMSYAGGNGGTGGSSTAAPTAGAQPGGGGGGGMNGLGSGAGGHGKVIVMVF